MKRLASTQGTANASLSTKRAGISREPIPSSPGDFPRFLRGSVSIKLSPLPEHHYLLHKAVLERNSTWFAKELSKTFIDTPGISLGDNIKYRFDLMPSSAGSVSQLVRRTSSGGEILSVPPVGDNDQDLTRKPASSGGSKQDAVDDLSNRSPALPKHVKIDPFVKIEVIVAEKQEAAAVIDRNIAEACEDKIQQEHDAHIRAHDDLFRMLYNRAPRLSLLDLNLALAQCERIVIVAETYGSLPVVRPYLGNVLAQYRHALYAAVAQDPPRWLNLSVKLESGSIFSEALIHCAGSWPNWEWPTPADSIQTRCLELIAVKAKTLADLRSEIDREILMNSISDADGRPVTLESTPESWMVVQVFRDWLTGQMYYNRLGGKDHHGTYYRLMRKGGESYLPFEQQSEKLSAIGGNGMRFWGEIEEDLKALKTFAMQAVSQLVKNNLMLDVEAAGIQYLTCIDVCLEDYPWTDQVEH